MSNYTQFHFWRKEMPIAIDTNLHDISKNIKKKLCNKDGLETNFINRRIDVKLQTK